MAQHNELGKQGEKMAVAHLEKLGYEILATNFVYQKNEIDIIARLNDVIAIVEVKTRSTPDFGDPKDFLKPSQIKRIVAAAHHFVEEILEPQEDVEVRFDIMSIIKNKAGIRMEFITDAFYHF